MIQAGKLRHQITLYKEVKTSNALGESERNNKVIGYKRCEVITSTSEKDFNADREGTFNFKKFRLRYFVEYEDVKVIEFKKELLNVVEVENVGERNREIILTAQAL